MHSTPMVRALQRVALLILGSGLVLRLVLALAMSPAPELANLALILVVGTGSDLLFAATAVALVLAARLVGQRALITALALVAGVTLLLIVAELFFWREFQSRPDRLVFHYLAYPREVLAFLQDQFFIAALLVPFLLACAAVHVWLRQPLRNHSTGSRTEHGGWLLALLLALPGAGLSSFASMLEGRIAEQLANNAALGITQAAFTDVSQWHPHYATGDAPFSPPLPLPAFVSKRPWSDPPQHLVLIILESFAGPTWRDPTIRQGLLPEFSALADRSWYFDNAFASGSRTTRGMEALLNGMMPLPGLATSQRAAPERLPSLPRALRNAGWHSTFVYAGWPDFSDLTDYWRAIGFHESTSRDDFSASASEFETSWGYADERMFERLLQTMNQRTAQHERVFVSALTLSHHRPYDFPAGRIDAPADQRRSDYAMAYADWALGQFMAAAAQTPWYQDTLFIIAADHGARFHGNAAIPINSYRVPVLIYSPNRTEPRVLRHLASLIEVPGTALDLLSVADTEGFYGTHMLDSTRALVPVEHDYDVGLIEADGVTVVRRDRAAEFWQWASAEPSDTQSLRPGPVAPDALARVASWFKQAHERYQAEPSTP